MGSVSIDVPSVAADTHHGWPVVRPKLSTVGCTVTRKRDGGVTPVALAISSRAIRTSPISMSRSFSSPDGKARATSGGAGRFRVVLGGAGEVLEGAEEVLGGAGEVLGGAGEV